MLKTHSTNWTHPELTRPFPAPDARPDVLRGERYHTFRSLTHALGGALRIHDFQLMRDRYVIFSDLHKGTRHPKTDDFHRKDAFYCDALRYYHGQDYRLVLNGDIEEGWKDSYDQIVDAYEGTAFAMEREFASHPQRYFRTFGNHDDSWADPRLVDRYLKPVFGALKVYPAIVLGQRIIIAHGHQGDFNSDRTSWISQRVIRYVWRPLQYLTGLQNQRRDSRNHTEYSPRDSHLAAWARANRMILIAGHTHRPMLTMLNGENASVHYLNDGCAVHDDAITGLELDQGEIRLVKWDVRGQLCRTVLQSADLGAMLAAL